MPIIRGRLKPNLRTHKLLMRATAPTVLLLHFRPRCFDCGLQGSKNSIITKNSLDLTFPKLLSFNACVTFFTHFLIFKQSLVKNNFLRTNIAGQRSVKLQIKYWVKYSIIRNVRLSEITEYQGLFTWAILYSLCNKITLLICSSSSPIFLWV